MTQNGRPGTPAVVAWSGRLDLFARAPDDQLLHLWSRRVGDVADEGAELLPGTLAGDPCAVSPTPDRLHVFARGEGGFLLHWQWSDLDGRMTGPEDHPGGRIAYDPVAVGLPGGAMAVYARSATDDLLVWMSPDRHTWHDVRPVGGSATSKPTVVHRSLGVPDVFARGAAGALSHWGMVHVEGSGEDREGWEELGGNLGGPPAVVAWSGHRLDVVAPLAQGGIDHWGWAGLQRYYDSQGVWHTGRWYGPDAVAATDVVTGPPVVVSPGPNLAEVYARAADGRLLAWLWDGTQGGFSPYNAWQGPFEVSGPVGSAPAALVVDGGTQVYAWDRTGQELLVFRPAGGGVWTPGTWEFPWPSSAVVGSPLVRARTAVDYLLDRPSDLVVLGVSWSGYEVTGNPPALQRTPGAAARVALCLPPQHIGEEVSAGPGPWDPPIPEGAGVPFGTWRSVLSGPSQLVFEPTTDRIPLTAEGILTATRGARIVAPSVDGPAPQTTVELPWQLLVAPADDAVAEHRAGVVAGPEGSVGLWRTRVRSVHGTLGIVGAGGVDPFPMALGHGARQLVAAQDGPAHVDRLELSALGGSLSANGTWPSLSWEHEASLGRDHRVRVQVQGVLYPFGHRAEYVEVTERFPAEPDAEPIAMLRTRRVLSVTEPVRRRPDDPALARAFPFDAVELTTRQLGDVDDPWSDGEKFLRPPHPPGDLLAELERLREELRGLPEMPGDFVGGPPLMEWLVLAAEQDPDSELAADQARIAAEHLRLVEAIQRREEQIAAVTEARTQEVPWFFCPRRAGTWVTVTAQCRTGPTTLDLEVPVLFVVDQQLPTTATMQSFDSLQDGEVAQKLATKWATIRRDLGTVASPSDDDEHHAGVVSIAATPIDLVQSGQVGDTQIVDRLHVVGTLRGRAIHPRLGPESAAGGAAAGPVWGLRLGLPALRTLLPDQPLAHRALVRFSDEYEANGAEEQVTFVVPTGGGIPVDFTGNADRSGGLLSPKLTVDAISRKTGPVNRKGLQSHVPTDYFDPGATLLGFPLASLLAEVSDPPAITTDLSGPQPVVQLLWDNVTLVGYESFGRLNKPPTSGDPAPALTLTVRTCGAAATTCCTLTNFSLAFPAASPLLTLAFESLIYEQAPGTAPTLRLGLLDAKFTGALDVLQVLQEKMGLRGAVPTITTSADEIVASYALPVPDAAAGAFVMRNLVFRAAVVVPFRGEAPSVSVGFASRANPFNLSVLALGGGGYVDVELDHQGLRRLEIALEFGAAVAVDFVIARGEAHVLGGIRFALAPDRSVELTGYLRIGGSLEVLGLVSVSVELVLSLGYRTTGNRLVGRATLVIEIDLTLYSDTVELDSGEWVIEGGPTHRIGGPGAIPPPAPVLSGTATAPGGERGGEPDGEPDPFLTAWLAHRRAFEATPP